MPDVTIINLGSKTIHCKDKSERLLDIILSEVDWMHACGMKGRCTTCTAEIISGHDHLGDITEAEERFINLGRLKQGRRLACQAVVLDDVVVKVLDEYKLPHQKYSDE